jgi:AcrR family transcriptional regulator
MRKPLPPRPPAPTRPGRKLAAPERREALLEAALPLFARHGWLGTGTRELAAAAGVTEPVLYRHFADKEALFLAVLERAAARLGEVLARHVAKARGAEPRLAALAGALGEILTGRLADLRALQAAAVTVDQPAVTDAARSHLATLSRQLAEALTGTGLARSVDPLVAGGLLLEVGLGASVLWPLGVPVALRPDFRGRVLALLLRAFTA